MVASVGLVTTASAQSGIPAAPVQPREPICLPVPNGGTSGDVVVVNITNPSPEGVGYGALRPSDAVPIPARAEADRISSVNFAPGPPNPNLAFVPIGRDGRICYDSDGATSHVILDIAVKFLSVDTSEQQRLIDTRTTGSKVEPRVPLCVAIPRGEAGDVVAVNITNPGAEGVGYGALRSSDAAPIPARAADDQYSSVNFAPGFPNPNLAFATIGSDGNVCYDSDGAASHVILDLSGYMGGSNLDASEPRRLTDTRATGSKVEPRVPLCVAIPGGVAGDVAVFNITNPGAEGVGYGALRSSDAAPIPARAADDQYSSVNFAPGFPNPNLAFVTIGSDGNVCYDSDGAASGLILDLAATIPSVWIVGSEPRRLIDTRVGETVDVTAPEVSSVSVSPASVDTSDGAAFVTVTVKASDDASGIDRLEVGFVPSMGADPVVVSDFDLVAGTRFDGTFEGVLELPQFSEDDVWNLSVVSVEDEYANSSFYNNNEFDASFTVGTVDPSLP